ncbi:coiled-coil domain-containing protein 40-like [Genypterus blacodes]|uniref:coiled-coil domain-containing protein 40-like n=1 Tax=Genypterus blacodes TaxID=154954 RepID=UPI003F759975
MKMKQEAIQEEKEILKSYLAEADMQIKLWESKIQLLRETRAAVDSEREDIDMMKAAVHQKEVRLSQLNRQQVDLQRESSAAFARRESVLLYRDVMVHNLRKQAKTEEQCFAIMGLKRRIKDTRKDVVGSGKKITELQDSKESLSNSIEEQRQRINELRVRNDSLDAETIKLQNDKDRNLFLLVALQARAKQLQMVCDGTYQVPGGTNSESVDSALHQHQEFVDAASTVLQHVCDEFPQYRAVLRKPLLMLEAQQELSKMEA